MARVRPHTDRKFKHAYYVEAYRLAHAGLPDHEIAAALKVSGKTFRRWKRQRPAFLQALELAREKDPLKMTFEEYLYDKLSPKLRDLWNELTKFNRKAGGVVKVQELLQDKGVRVRQHLFLHALVTSNYNESQALKTVCVSKKVYDYWRDKDPEFEQLVKEMEWHKGNFYAGAFNEKVAEGDTSCILHAMKTFNRDRGYGERYEIDHTHAHVHAVGVVDFDRLATFLDVETKRKVLAAIDQAQKALPAHVEVEDAEFEVKDGRKV